MGAGDVVLELHHALADNRGLTIAADQSVLGEVGLVEDDHWGVASPVLNLLDALPGDLRLVLLAFFRLRCRPARLHRVVGCEHDPIARVDVVARRPVIQAANPAHERVVGSDNRLDVALGVFEQIPTFAHPERLLATLVPVVEDDAGQDLALTDAGSVAEEITSPQRFPSWQEALMPLAGTANPLHLKGGKWSLAFLVDLGWDGIHVGEPRRFHRAHRRRLYDVGRVVGEVE